MMMDDNDDECGAVGEMRVSGSRNTEKIYAYAALSTTNTT
jgi:hypothetical protein